MATCSKFNDVHHKISQKKRKSLFLFKKRIVYDSLKVKHWKNTIFEKFNFSRYYSYRASLKKMSKNLWAHLYSENMSRSCFETLISEQGT